MNEMEVQFTSAVDLAQKLINNDVKLSELNSIAAFAAKADNTEEATWALCKNANNYSRYLEIYPNGKHKSEVEELMWNDAIKRNDMSLYVAYLEKYPNGIHAADVDDKVWAIAIDNGTITAYLHLFENGNHSQDARLILENQQQEEIEWQEAKAFDTVASYQGYIKSYKEKQGKHINDATNRIAELIEVQKESAIRALAENCNKYPLDYIKTVLNITKDNLKGRIKDSRGNVQDIVLDSWDKIPKKPVMGKTPTQIPKGSTEVYFWGVPGSGKTCAMAAILSQACQMGCFAPRKGEGLGYMNELASIFELDRDRPAVCLPPASDVDTTQYLPLTLNEVIMDKRGHQTIKKHNLSVIEISGEIFECFSDEIEGKSFKSKLHEETYEQLKEYLMSKDNPKFHFFILDSKPLQDSNQKKYLQNAVLYFQEEDVFNSTTQGISLIVTKSDVLSPDRSKWVECAKNAAMENFGSLVNQLKLIVGSPEEGGLGISDGTLPVIPLSIGEVFFQRLCLFDPEPSKVLVNLLIEYSKVAETTDWKKKTKWFFNK